MGIVVVNHLSLDGVLQGAGGPTKTDATALRTVGGLSRPTTRA